MLGTIVHPICWVWIIEVAAALLMYAWASVRAAVMRPIAMLGRQTRRTTV